MNNPELDKLLLANPSGPFVAFYFSDRKPTLSDSPRGTARSFRGLLEGARMCLTSTNHYNVLVYSKDGLLFKLKRGGEVTHLNPQAVRRAFNPGAS